MPICGTPGVIETQTGTCVVRSSALCGLTLKMELVVFIEGVNSQLISSFQPQDNVHRVADPVLFRRLLH
jgi:hypothetical protein